MTTIDEVSSTPLPGVEETRLTLAPYFLPERFGGYWLPDGWRGIALRLHLGIVRIHPEYRIVQVKEKFGTMRYYLDSYPTDVRDELDLLIRGAEAESAVTCQNCGEPGVSREHGYVATLCDECDGGTVASGGYYRGYGDAPVISKPPASPAGEADIV